MKLIGLLFFERIKGSWSPRFSIYTSQGLPNFLNVLRSFHSLGWTFFFVFSLFCRATATETLFTPSGLSNSLDNSNGFARSAAMGSAFSGTEDDASALFSNPAGLAGLRQGQLFFNSDFWLVGTLQETVLLGIPLSSHSGIGVAGHYLDYGTFDGRDALGSSTSSYSADRLDFEAGGGIEILKDVSVGLAFNGTQTTLAGVVYSHFASSLGVLWKSSDGLRLGGSFINGGLISPGGPSNDAIELGASYQATLDVHNSLLVALGGTIEPNAVQYLKAGAEYELEKQLFLRAGYQLPLTDNGIGGLTGLTAGLGLNLSGFQFDYAYLPYGDLGDSHRISVGYSFETLEKPEKDPSRNEAKTKVDLRKDRGLKDQGSLSGTIAGNSPGDPKETQGLPRPSSDSTTIIGGPEKGVSQPLTAKNDDKKDSLILQFEEPSDEEGDAAELTKEGKVTEALGAYKATLQANPQDVSAWWAMGDLYRKMNQKQNAIQCFDHVAHLQPTNKAFIDWFEQYRSAQP